jgi:hypothetical protein
MTKENAAVVATAAAACIRCGLIVSTVRRLASSAAQHHVEAADDVHGNQHQTATPIMEQCITQLAALAHASML